MQNLKTKQNKIKTSQIESKLEVTYVEGGLRVGEMDEGGQLHGDGW